MSELISKFRNAYKGKSNDKLVDLYFQLMTEGDACRKIKDYHGLLMRSQMMLPLIEPLIRDCNKYSTGFNITKIPAIDWGCRYWPAACAMGQLENLKEVIEFFDELRPWHTKVLKAIEECVCALEIKKILSTDANISEKEFQDNFDKNKRNMVKRLRLKMKELGTIS